MGANPQLNKIVEQMTEQHIFCFVPIMTRQKMALYSGLTEGQIYSMLKKATLPSYTIGRVQLVNLAKIFVQQNLMSSAMVGSMTEQQTAKGLLTSTPKHVIPMVVPHITKQRFSDLVGVTDGQVQGWISKGHVPTVKTGRHRLIDLVELFSQCSETNVHLMYSVLPN